MVNSGDFESIYKFIGLQNHHKDKTVIKNKTDEKVFPIPKYLEPMRKNKIIKNIFGTYHHEGLLINRYFNVLKLFSPKKIPYPVISDELYKKLINLYIPDIKMLSENQNIDYIKKWKIDN